MTDLGLPPQPSTCPHTVPVFGCSGCIERDQGKLIESIIKAVCAPECCCGLEMKACASKIIDGNIEVEYACPAEDGCKKEARLILSAGIPKWEIGE